MCGYPMQVLAPCICVGACVNVLDAEGILTAAEPPKSLAGPQSRNRLDKPAGHREDGGGGQ